MELYASGNTTTFVKPGLQLQEEYRLQESYRGGFFKPKAARLGMREDAQAKTLPPRYKTEVVADSGGSAVVQVLGQGQKKVNLFDSLILT